MDRGRESTFGSVHMNTPRVRNAAITQLTPAAALGETIRMNYDEDITLTLNVCFNDYQPDYNMTSSLIATQGTFTQFVCTALPCVPDSEYVICSQDSPMPITACMAMLKTKPKQLYVTLHAAGGRLDATTKTYVSEVKFGASFKQVN